MAYSKTNYVDGVTPLNAKNFNNNESGLDQVSKDVASISQALVQVDDKVEGKADIGHTHSELHSHSNKSVLDGVTSAKVTEWNNKSNFSGNYNDLTNKPTIPTVDVNKSYVDTELAKKSNTGHEHSEYTTETRVSNMIAEAQLGGGEVDLSGYATKDDLKTKSDVGHGHSYNDLTNKPTIPSITGLATTTYVDTGLSKKSDTHTHPYKSDTYVPTWSEITGKPTIPTVDVNKAYVDGELAKKSNTGHRHDASEIDNLPTSGGSSDVTKAYVDSQDKVLDDKITVLSAKVDGLEQGGNLVIRDIEDGEIFEIDNDVPVISVASISLNKSTTSINVGVSETLSATVLPSNASNKSVVWSSSNNSIATVSGGVVTGVGVGSATISATTNDGGFVATCSVTVSAIPVTSVTLDKSTHTFKVDETVQLTATILPSNATNKNITWISSDDSKANVVNGLVTAIAEGNTNITVATSDGNKTAICSLTINAKNEVAPGEELNPSVKDGLIGMWDFTKQSGEDLIGSNDFNMSTQQFKYGGYMTLDVSPVHLQSNILPSTHTLFVTAINRAKERPTTTQENPMYYFGGKNIAGYPSKIRIGGVGQTIDNSDNCICDGICNTIALSFNSTSKQYKLYKDGVIIFSGSDTGTYTDTLFRILNQNSRNVLYNAVVYNRILTDDEIKTTSDDIKVFNKTLNTLDFDKDGLTEVIKFNTLSYQGDMYANNSKLLNFITSESNATVDNIGYKQLSGSCSSTHFLPVDNKNWTLGIRVHINETSNKIVFNTPNVSLYVSTNGVGLKINNGTASSLYSVGEVANIILKSSETDGVKMYIDGVLKHTNSNIINALTLGTVYMSASLNIYNSLIVYNRCLDDSEIIELNSKMEVY